MRKVLLSVFFVCASLFALAQSEKQVKWDYTVKKINDKTYEVHMTATIGENFHMYAQHVGVDGPLGTAFTFTKNPLLILDGNVKEEGKLVKKFEPIWKGSVNYYEKKVNFVQVVKLKANVKTNLSGKVEFMVCDEKLCLPPGNVPIKVSVGG